MMDKRTSVIQPEAPTPRVLYRHAALGFSKERILTDVCKTAMDLPFVQTRPQSSAQDRRHGIQKRPESR